MADKKKKRVELGESSMTSETASIAAISGGSGMRWIYRNSMWAGSDRNDYINNSESRSRIRNFVKN